MADKLIEPYAQGNYHGLIFYKRGIFVWGGFKITAFAIGIEIVRGGAIAYLGPFFIAAGYRPMMDEAEHIIKFKRSGKQIIITCDEMGASVIAKGLLLAGSHSGCELFSKLAGGLDKAINPPIKEMNDG